MAVKDGEIGIYGILVNDDSSGIIAKAEQIYDENNYGNVSELIGNLDSGIQGLTERIESLSGTVSTVSSTVDTLSSNVTSLGSNKADKTELAFAKGSGTHSAVLKDSGSTASGYATVACGDHVTVSGNYSFAEGQETQATGTCVHTEGYRSKAIGNTSHAECSQTQAKGNDSHAEGQLSISEGEASHAEGIQTSAAGKAAHAEGYYTKTTNQAEHASGQYNVSEADRTLFSVGIGESDTARKNALELTKTGDLYLKGIGSFDGTNFTDAKTVQTVINSLNGLVGTLRAWTYIKTLTTDSTETDILAALYVTDLDGTRTTTKEALFAILDQCTVNGKWLKESSESSKVTVEYIGSAYVISIFGSAPTIVNNSKVAGVPVVRTITISGISTDTLQVIRAPQEIPLYKIPDLVNQAKPTVSVISESDATVITDAGTQTVYALTPTRYQTNSFQTIGSSTQSITNNEISHLQVPSITGFTTLNNFANGCYRLTGLDVSKWDTSKVTNMRFAFAGAFYNQEVAKSVELDTTYWDTSNVLNMNYTFGVCAYLTSLKTDYWDLSKCGQMQYTFYNCVNLSELNPANWYPDLVETFACCFANCSSLTKLNLANWAPTPQSSVYMFYGCSNLLTLRLDKWNNADNTNVSYMFTGCTSLHEFYLGPDFFHIAYGDNTTLDFSSITQWTDSSLKYSLYDNLYNRAAGGYTHAAPIIVSLTTYRQLTPKMKTRLTDYLFELSVDGYDPTAGTTVDLTTGSFNDGTSAWRNTWTSTDGTIIFSEQDSKNNMTSDGNNIAIASGQAESSTYFIHAESNITSFQFDFVNTDTSSSYELTIEGDGQTLTSDSEGKTFVVVPSTKSTEFTFTLTGTNKTITLTNFKVVK